MISNTTLKEIGNALLGCRSAVLFPHENPDGDAIGSCVALCCALRKHGVDAWVLIDEPLPEYIGFIDNTAEGETPCCTVEQGCIAQPDVCMFVDCAGVDRIPGREDAFRAGQKTICIDHHRTSHSSEDLYFIDGDEAAAAQIIYRFLLEMDVAFDRKMANAIYAGICTDTGNFQYSNTTSESHSIAAELFAIGIDHDEIMVKLYQNVDIRQTMVESMAVSQMELFAGGKGAIACVDKALMQRCGARLEHAENLINVLRDIKGVEVAVVLKEREDGAIKVSFRSKNYADVSAIAEAFDGGGHIRASGCTLYHGMEDAKTRIMTAVEEALA